MGNRDIKEIAKYFSKFVTNFADQEKHSPESIQKLFNKAGFTTVEAGAVNKVKDRVRYLEQNNQSSALIEGISSVKLAMENRYERIVSLGLSTTRTIAMDNALRHTNTELATADEYNFNEFKLQ